LARDDNVKVARKPARTRKKNPEFHDGNEGLVVEGLSKTYRRRPVVRNVSLSLRRGEAVGLLGPNGAGKTTVFYMITGLMNQHPRAAMAYLDKAAADRESIVDFYDAAIEQV